MPEPRPRRLVIEPGQPTILARLTRGTTQLAGPVTGLTSETLEVRLAPPPRPPLELNERLSPILLTLDGATPLRLTGARVVAVELEEGGAHRIALEAEDDASRAALWLTLERGAPEPSPAVDSTIHSLPARGQYTEDARRSRLDFLRERTHAALRHLDATSLRPERLTGNIENLIGSVEIPVGVAGPLLFNGQHARGVLYAPMATTEGALVASATRGARAITRAGGVTTRVLRQQMMRVPLFVLSNTHGAFLFAAWVRDHVDAVREQVQRVSAFAHLISLDSNVLGRQVHVRFLYETGDAAGQNMTTSCTWHACQWLMAQTRHFEEVAIDTFVIEGNMSGDKKVNFSSFLNGRGTRVVAEAHLDRETVRRVLKVSPEHLAQTTHRLMTGSFQVGMVGFNINVANAIAAIFTATGQDIACVHETALGQLHVELDGDTIHASMLLPSLIVGTVGGGTHLPRQHDLLSLMGCAGPGKVSRFAEAIAGFCLALDLSTLSAVAGGQFAHAHDRLGRNRPVRWLRREDLTPAFFTPGLRAALDAPALTVDAVEPIEGVRLGSSILTELTARKVRKLVGHLPLRLSHSRGVTEVIAKVKPLDDEVILMTNALASMCGGRLAETYARFKDQVGFAGCHLRELRLYEQTDPRFTAHTPRLFGLHEEAPREAYVLVLEYLRDVELLDTADDLRGWTPAHIEAALRGLAELHAIWYERTDELEAEPWLGTPPTAARMTEMTPLWDALGVHAREEFPEWISPSDLSALRQLVADIPDWWGRLERHPKTLIHNDFNPRNLCFRRDPAGPRLCVYDWELATIGAPQHDLAELLAFVLPPNVEMSTVDHYVEHARRALERALGAPLDPARWRAGYNLCLRDLVVNRVGMYLMAHTFRHYGFMQRVARTLRRLVALETGFDAP